jgi:hypothetical protein
MVIPNKKLEINENLMIVVVAVGSFMLLDTMCPNKKGIESMKNIIPNDKSIHAPVDMDLEIYSGASMQNKSEDFTEEEHSAFDEDNKTKHFPEEKHDHKHLSESEEEEIHEFVEEHVKKHKHSEEEFEKQEEEIDNRIEEELGCDCSDEIKKIRDMFTSEVQKIKSSSDKIKKDLEDYKRKYEREK